MGVSAKSLETLQRLAEAQYLAACGKLGRIQHQLAAIDQGIADATRPPHTQKADELFAAGERARWQDSQRRQLRVAREKILPDFETARQETSRSLGRVRALEHLATKARKEARLQEERADEIWVTLLTNLKPSKRW